MPKQGKRSELFCVLCTLYVVTELNNFFFKGFGSSNDGNTARKFFENCDIVAEITGVCTDLINHFYYILMAINISEDLDPELFGEYAFEAAKIIVDKYNWFYMTPTVHKVLLHGQDIIAYAILPLGMYKYLTSYL